MKTVDELITELHKKCTNANGCMPVYTDDLETADDLLSNVVDEIMGINMAIEHGEVEDEFGYNMTFRQGQGMVVRLENFLKRHSQKYYEMSQNY